MMMKNLFLFILTGALIVACGGQQQSEAEGDETNIYKTLPGDSTRYGLACDGSTDSILVFLPYGSTRLDTFDIITAFQNRKIFGRPHIGDDLAIIVNPEDTVEAMMVINLESLKGTWCYMVTPTLRHIDKMPKRMQRRMMERIPDSLYRKWMAPREYSLHPAFKRYTDWHIYNGRLILKADTIAGFTQEGDVPTTDTVNIVMLRRDTLVLQFPDHEQSYYRKEKE